MTFLSVMTNNSIGGHSANPTFNYRVHSGQQS